MISIPVKIKGIVNYKQENPFSTLSDIGNKFSCSRQYIYQVLKAHNVVTTRVKKKPVQYCLICQEPSTRLVHKGKCHFAYYRIRLTCHVCRTEFYRKRGEVANNYRREYKGIFCSRSCFDNRRQRHVFNQ